MLNAIGGARRRVRVGLTAALAGVGVLAALATAGWRRRRPSGRCRHGTARPGGGVIGRAMPGGEVHFPTLFTLVPNGAPNQQWAFRRVGGTLQEPWYQIVNTGNGQCLAYAPRGDLTEVRPCSQQAPPSYRTDWWQFRVRHTYARNPGLSGGGGTWNIHWYEPTGSSDWARPGASKCLVSRVWPAGQSGADAPPPGQFTQAQTRSCAGWTAFRWTLTRQTVA